MLLCRLAACVKLCRLRDALAVASALGTADAWRQLGLAAMQLLDVGLALAAFRQVGRKSNSVQRCPLFCLIVIISREAQLRSGLFDEHLWISFACCASSTALVPPYIAPMFLDSRVVAGFCRHMTLPW